MIWKLIYNANRFLVSWKRRNKDDGGLGNFVGKQCRQPDWSMVVILMTSSSRDIGNKEDEGDAKYEDTGQ